MHADSSITIEQQCSESKSRYVPLSQRTVTLKDLPHSDLIDSVTDSEPELRAYESAATRFAEKRERIQETFNRRSGENNNYFDDDYLYE